MEYNPDGTMKQTLKLYPQKLYKNTGEMIVVNNDQERNAAIATGAKLTVPPVVAYPTAGAGAPSDDAPAPASKPKSRSAR